MASPQPRRPVSNLLGLAVLSYLTQRPMHAYELQRQLKDNDAARTFKLSYGALYSVVGQLSRAGLVSEAGSGRTGNRPAYTVYELTSAGRLEMHAWLHDLLATPQHEYPSFAAALSLAVVLPPAEVADLFRIRLGRLDAEARAIQEQTVSVVASGVHPLFLVEDDYRVALLRAESEFIAGLLERITDPSWVAGWSEFHSDANTTSEGHQP